ncbi:MAG: hypothetical protein HY369_03425 [Candidatus Aenigmarchaeota archaeon]|nr:hypothetical protein [Candidatus Aenigmarchaeota archaeon]
MADVEFKTLQAEEIKFGKNNFLEVARKKAVAQEGENEFIAISRGFFTQDGTKRFRRSIALPDQDEIVDFVVKSLQQMHGKATAGKKKEAHHEAPAEDVPEEPAE